MYGTKLYENADWPDAARSIIEKSGIEPECGKSFSYKLQDIDADSIVMLSAGSSTELTLNGITGKSRRYDLSKAAVYTKSSNEGVLSANGLNITAIGTGECTVTIAVVENGICLMKNVTVLVS